MNFNLIPSLEHIALVKVAILLWDKQDIADLASQRYAPTSKNPQYSDRFREKEGDVVAKVNELPLPEPLKKKLPSLIKPIGWQMWTWFHYPAYYDLDMKPTEHFFWTQRGSLDTKKTTRRLLENENIDFARRCEIAAIHCLEVDYFNLVKQTAEISKFCSMERSVQFFAFLTELNLRNRFRLGLQFRIMYVRDIETDTEYMFRYAAVGGNEAATKYLLEKLTPEEKKKTLVKTVCFVASISSYHVHKYPLSRKSHFANVLHFLLSVLTEEQLIEVFRKDRDNFKVIQCFLEYPWQYLFLDMLEHVRDFFGAESFFHLVNSICNKIQQSYEDYDYEGLLLIVWEKIPKAIKLSFSERPYFQRLMSILPKERGVKNLLLVTDMLVLNGQVVIFQDRGKSFCQSLISQDQWNVFKSFIEKCISSKDLMIKFKGEMENFLYLHRHAKFKLDAVSQSQREKSFDIIDECIQSLSNMEEVNVDRSA